MQQTWSVLKEASLEAELRDRAIRESSLGGGSTQRCQEAEKTFLVLPTHSLSRSSLSLRPSLFLSVLPSNSERVPVHGASLRGADLKLAVGRSASIF